MLKIKGNRDFVKITFSDIRSLGIDIQHCFVPASKQRKIMSFKSGGRFGALMSLATWRCAHLFFMMISTCH